MKCFLPKVTSIQQKIFCVSSGVLFTTTVVGGIYHCSIPMPKLLISKQIINICQCIPDIQDNNNVFKKYWNKMSNPDLDFRSIIRYFGIVNCTLFPIIVGHNMYGDWKKFTRMNECCGIIRNAAIQTVFFPIKMFMIILSISVNYLLITEIE